MPGFIFAAQEKDAVINEIAWMGTSAASSSDEWLELFNNTASNIDLTDWQIVAGDGTPTINLINSKINPNSIIIPANGYFLLERTNNNTLPDITADFIYTGAMGNGGENLSLLDNEGKIIDSVNFSERWPAGDNTTKSTMERINPLLSGSDLANWQNSTDGQGNAIPGTPKARNSSFAPEPATEPPAQSNQPQLEPTPSSSPTAAPSPPPPPLSPDLAPNATEVTAPEIIDYSGIIISEFMPAGEEWVELFNESDLDIDLKDWQIDDIIQGSSPYKIKDSLLIKEGQYIIVTLPRAILNDNGDQVRLIAPNEQIMQIVSYEKAEKDQSAAFDGASWFWTDTPTPGRENEIVTQPVQKTTAAQKVATEQTVSSVATINAKTPASNAKIAQTAAEPKESGATDEKSNPQTNSLPNGPALASVLTNQSFLLNNRLILLTVSIIIFGVSGGIFLVKTIKE